MKRYKLIFCLTSLAILLTYIAVIVVPFVIENIFLPSILAGRQYPVDVVSIRIISESDTSTLYEYTVSINGVERTIQMVKYGELDCCEYHRNLRNKP